MSPSKQLQSRHRWRPGGPPRRAVLFVNPHSGDGTAARAAVAERARARGIEVVTLTPGQDLAELAEAAVASATRPDRSPPPVRLAGGTATAALHGEIACQPSVTEIPNRLRLQQ